MANVVFNARERNLWLNSQDDVRRKISNDINSLAGHLGGWGINLTDSDGNDLSINEEFDFSYCEPPPRFKFGDHIITIDHIETRDFVGPAQAYRTAGKRGIIVGEEYSHGLCYRIIHDDDTVAYYDPDELELIVDPDELELIIETETT